MKEGKCQKINPMKKSISQKKNQNQSFLKTKEIDRTDFTITTTTTEEELRKLISPKNK